MGRLLGMLALGFIGGNTDPGAATPKYRRTYYGLRSGIAKCAYVAIRIESECERDLKVISEN